MVDVTAFGLIALILATPVVIIAFRRGMTDTVRRFAIVGASVAAGCALVSLGSDALVTRCFDAGNTGCLDYGARGVQALALGLYGVVAVLRAVGIARS